MARAGTVYLIGAGPGDPKLITVGGADALRHADVVVYDRLAHPSLLDYAPAAAERVYVGKQADRHAMRQDDINALLADRGLSGKTVARLKGGDPFVFGRGGEEAEYLRERGVPFVVIPGVTSAIAAPAYAGIPVTHRDMSSSFAVITGHERDDSRESGTRLPGGAEQRRQWDKIAWAGDTLLFLMGVENLDEIVAKLIEHGRLPETPVALVRWGTWAGKQETLVGTLGGIVARVREARFQAPAVTIVGDVVSLRERLRWFDQGPLFGKRIVVTRAREAASGFCGRAPSTRRGAGRVSIDQDRPAAGWLRGSRCRPDPAGRFLLDLLRQCTCRGGVLGTADSVRPRCPRPARNQNRCCRARHDARAQDLRHRC